MSNLTESKLAALLKNSKAIMNKVEENTYQKGNIDPSMLIAEGDLVALHTHQIWPGNDQYVTMDFFRFDDNGKIVEHWDAIQQIPKSSANNNTMY